MSCDPKEENKGVTSPAVSFMLYFIFIKRESKASRYLFDHLSVAAEDGQRRARVVRSDVVFLSAAHLHGEQMPLIT